MDAGIDAFTLLLDLLRLAKGLEDCLLVEFVEEHHLQGLLALLDQEETDDLGDAVVEDLNNDHKVSVQTLLDLVDEEFLRVLVG